MSNRIAAIARTTAAHAKPVALPVLFSVLMWASAAAGAVPIPGTPVPITLQTFVVMLAGLLLFAGGMATASLVSPSGGFLIGFLPGVVVTALLKGAVAALAAAGISRL